jgi:hypothetical protein
MSIRAVSVADIASATGTTINHLSWELLQGNSVVIQERLRTKHIEIVDIYY